MCIICNDERDTNSEYKPCEIGTYNNYYIINDYLLLI